jgi:hypothetical protein
MEPKAPTIAAKATACRLEGVTATTKISGSPAVVGFSQPNTHLPPKSQRSGFDLIKAGGVTDLEESIDRIAIPAEPARQLGSVDPGAPQRRI